MVGIENAGGIAFAFANSPVVVYQLAQLFYGIADVCTKHVLAIELVIHLTDWALQKCNTARVSRAMP